jgi:glycosyltransferase involved in cell wall biosynthesis
MNILQVSTADVAGGAERIAYTLFKRYREWGHGSWLAVGRKRTAESGVIEMSRRTNGQAGRLRKLTVNAERAARSVPGVGKVMTLVQHPRRAVESRLGVEDFNYPESQHVLELAPQKPDILHCHNLHGGYFDLRALPRLSHRVPTIVTLHDAWLMSGHCAHSFDCDRWETGCGQCPSLDLYPAIARDATAYNWRRKRNILRQSRLYVATPSEWLRRRLERSIAAASVVESRVIPNGVDTSIFTPGDQIAARLALKLPTDARVLLFAANGVRRNVWKDYGTMREAIADVAEQRPAADFVFIALGEEAPPEQIGRARVQFVPYQQDPRVVALFYQAADMYLHAARAEVWGLTVTEALACGTPVIATAVGGIPEQLKGLGLATNTGDLNRFDADEATGILVPPGDGPLMARSIRQLLDDDTLRRRLGANAAKDASERFALSTQARAYVQWYEQVIEELPERIA